uniref:Uncharacterized protein n=1 Tax=Salix viminalis TaxID=40686 RepID=A0A6N2M5K9_SALVM
MAFIQSTLGVAMGMRKGGGLFSRKNNVKGGRDPSPAEIHLWVYFFGQICCCLMKNIWKKSSTFMKSRGETAFKSKPKAMKHGSRLQFDGPSSPETRQRPKP